MKTLLYLALTLSVSNSLHANDSLYFKLDSFKAPSYELKITNGKGIILYYRGGLGLRDPESNWCVGEFGKIELDLVMLTLKEEGVFNWEKKYINYNIKDGTMYQLFVETDGKRFTSIGINEFPENFDKLEKIMLAIESNMNCESRIDS